MKPTAYRVTPAPHLRDPNTVIKVWWSRSAALLPLIFAYAIFFYIQALRILAVTLAAAFAAEWTASKLFKRKPCFENGANVWNALLFSLLIPPSTPSGMAAAGIFAGIFLGREIFGGAGAAFLSPALLGHAILQLSDPEIFLRGGILSMDSGLGVGVTSGAILLGGIIFAIRKPFYGEVPAVYLALIFLLEKIMPFSHEISGRRLFFAALMLLTDPAILPLTRRARLIWALFAAALTHALMSLSGVPLPEVFAVLSAGLLTPWLDQWVLPAGAVKIKERVKI